MKRAIVIVLAALTTSACSGSPAAATLGGRSFLSTTVRDAPLERPLAPGTRIQLTFGGSALSVSAGCNAMTGKFALEGTQLDASIDAMTALGCDAARSKQDTWVAEFLGSRPSVHLTGSELVLTSGGITITLVDRVVAEPDAPLVGTTWRIVGIVSGDAVSSVPGGAATTMTFGADGNVAVQTGCNSGSGSYTVTGGMLQFGPLALTKRACTNLGARAAEAAIVSLVNAGAVSYKIEASTLGLSNGDRGLQLRAS
jgi:heat shock protein HslJ